MMKLNTKQKHSIAYNGHRYMQFFLKLEHKKLNNMKEVNKNTEVNDTDKKLYISVS